MIASRGMGWAERAVVNEVMSCGESHDSSSTATNLSLESFCHKHLPTLLSSYINTSSPSQLTYTLHLHERKFTTMANNTRYERVPTQDNYQDEPAAAPGYTQAPPSYQAEPAIGTPRTEDDNVPDDFKFGGSVAEATLPIR